MAEAMCFHDFRVNKLEASLPFRRRNFSFPTFDLIEVSLSQPVNVSSPLLQLDNEEFQEQ